MPSDMPTRPAPEEQTLIILKPDAVARGLVGRILSRFEEKGLRFAAMKLMMVSEEMARRHYAEHMAKAFFKQLVEFLISAPVLVMVVQGMRAITVCRGMMGKTFGYDSPPGTIRGDFGMSRSLNLIHGSDSVDAARREIALFFRPDELIGTDRELQRWIYGSEDWLMETPQAGHQDSI